MPPPATDGIAASIPAARFVGWPGRIKGDGMNAHVTPMMAQYLEIKAQVPGRASVLPDGPISTRCSSTTRVAAAEALDIALTRRGKHGGEDIPMCGVPVHAAEGYLLTLIRKGFRVAVCEQMEDPAEAKKRGGSKAVVRRDVGPAGDARNADRGCVARRAHA